MTDVLQVEAARQVDQRLLDGERTPKERNRLGQFATPPVLARDLLHYLKPLMTASPIKFLEPAIGTGAFYSALLQTVGEARVAKALGFDVDARFVEAANRLWRETPLEVVQQDFTIVPPPWFDPERFNLVIANPPYVRHHHLAGQDKVRLQHQVKNLTGYHVSQLAGLYCHFLLLSHVWMEADGLACWLIPSEFMDVNYGQTIKSFLLREVTLLRIHRFDEAATQFSDALVSSAAVVFRKRKPQPAHSVEFTHGGTLTSPERCRVVASADLDAAGKWTRYGRDELYARQSSEQLRLGDLFDIQRGLATGDNAFFVVTPETIEAWELPESCLTPILPSPRYLKTEHVEADADGKPALTKPLFLVNCTLPETVVETEQPALWRYLQHGRERGVHEGYLCKNRTPWYAQEKRPAAPLLCTYMGRSRTKEANPFRFILNESSATAANSYLMLYPTEKMQTLARANPAIYKDVWRTLNNLSRLELINEGRVYGNGLHKLEPKELANVLITGFVPAVSPPEAAD